MRYTARAGLKWQTCLVYLDDVIVFSSNFDEHLWHLEAVLQAIKTSELTLKLEKCHFAFEDLLLLGQVISKSRVHLDQRRTGYITAFPLPTDKKAMHQFLGVCASYRRFVKKFARIAEPLFNLTKNNVEFKWETP